MFCGDGINDLAALSAADMGVSVGAGAVIAAELSASKASVAGQCCITCMHATCIATCVITYSAG